GAGVLGAGRCGRRRGGGSRLEVLLRVGLELCEAVRAAKAVLDALVPMRSGGRSRIDAHAAHRVDYLVRILRPTSAASVRALMPGVRPATVAVTMAMGVLVRLGCHGFLRLPTLRQTV